MIHCIENGPLRLWKASSTADGQPAAQKVPLAELRVHAHNEQQTKLAKAAGGKPRLLKVPKRVREDLPVRPYINHARWIVECPFCRDAVEMAFSDLRFVCANERCNGGGVSGAHGEAMRVVLPPLLEMLQMEVLLELRPRPENKNADPGETVADLVRENLSPELRALGCVHTFANVQITIADLMPGWLELHGAAARAIEALLPAAWGC